MKITQTGKKESKQHKKPRNNENKATDDVEDEKNAKKSQDARHELAYPPPPRIHAYVYKHTQLTVAKNANQ